MITRVLVRDIMNSPVVSTSAETNIKALAIKMKDERVGSIVVTNKKGDPDGNIPPGTPFEKLPDDWTCPVCGAAKSEFEKE